MTFGELLRRHRKAAGIAQETLAERAHLSVETVGALERGTRQRPYLDTISSLAEALGLSVDDRAELERAASRGDDAARLPANNLPAEISSFIGREHDVTKVRELLTSHRIVTLVGPGGVGKTRLALRVAGDLVAARSDGAWFVDFAPISEASRIPSVIAAGVGLPQSLRLKSLIDALRTMTILLVVDNCEHLVGDIALAVNAILRECPNIAILATSREPLSTEAERLYRVPTLELNDAVKLFVDRAQGADSRFALDDPGRKTVADICRRLDGIALAIEIAAARTGVVSLETVALELGEHLNAAIGRRRTVVSRQRTMETLFDWSYGLLDERESLVFRRLSVFVGGFSEELAVAICANSKMSKRAVSGALASLVTKSLVQGETDGAAPRYRLLEPVRQYAREKLRAREEDGDSARAHALALLALAAPFDTSLEVPSDRLFNAVVQPERENFRAAVEWSLSKNGNVEIAQRLVGSITVMWYGVMSGEGQRSMIQSALNTCDATTPHKVRARLELAAARHATEFASDMRAALAAAEQALHGQPPDDIRGIASAQYLVGLGLSRCGRIVESESAFRQALAKARSAGAKGTIAAANAGLAAVRLLTGDLDEARSLVREALHIHRDAECERLGAATAVHMAEIEFAADQTETALSLSQDASNFYRKERNWWLLAFILANQSAYAVALGRYDQARDDAREALLLGDRIGLRRSASWALQHLAAVAGFRNHVEADRRDVRRSAQLLGFVDEAYGRGGAIREHTEQRERDKLIAALREALGETMLVALMAEGASWTEDRAHAEALEI
ncbi:MAG TPA: helix-turn-helix domain-containing protein [Candidatus Baltobacteraceae bacterium]|jgi:predicted ATPase/DNA-binding XRE family transcriptional regulator